MMCFKICGGLHFLPKIPTVTQKHTDRYTKTYRQLQYVVTEYPWIFIHIVVKNRWIRSVKNRWIRSVKNRWIRSVKNRFFFFVFRRRCATTHVRRQ